MAKPSKRVAIHQPNYIPYCGYFYKMAQVDTFVFLDAVQYPRGSSYAARNCIKSPAGPIFLSIPCSIPHGYEGRVRYGDVKFANIKWKDKHKRTLELNYRRAPFFKEIFDIYCREVNRCTRFLDLNINLIRAFAEYLEIKTECISLSDILSDFGSKTQLIIDVCQQLQADNYLSGTGGGKEYNDESLLDRNGIQLTYSDFSPLPYPQLWGEFSANLSILDFLFNCGPESNKLLLAMRRKD